MYCRKFGARCRGKLKTTADYTDLKLTHFPIRSPLPIAALPSMSLIPSAPFTDFTNSADGISSTNRHSLPARVRE
jgi:hypothetical protein